MGTLSKSFNTYKPILNWSLTNGRALLAAAVLAVIGVSLLIPLLGSEFVPRLDEGAIAIGVLRLPSVSLAESVSQATLLEKTLLEEFPDEISTVVSKTGRAEIAADPMGAEMSDVFVELKPREQWKRAHTKTELERAVAEECRRIPGLNFTFSQPIELRVNELVAGVRSDLAIRLYGDDLDTLLRKGDEVLRAVQQIAGASDFKVQQISGLPSLEIVVDQDKIARYGINSSVAVLNGLVMVSYINSRRAEDVPLLHAVREGAITRLRPVLMTALVASLGFIPMAVSTGSGAEVQRPLATVVIGGLISSTILTLLVLPVLYGMIETRFTQSRAQLA